MGRGKGKGKKKEVSRINAAARERLKKEAKTRVWGKSYAVQRAAAEADANIRSNVETEREKKGGQRIMQAPMLRLRRRKRRIRRGRIGRKVRHRLIL